MNISTTVKNCSVNITTNRNRLKVYNSSVYLQDGQRFELEIHNPHTYKVLAKIKMNGNYISSSGIVINPGQRVFLERFIDKNEAFVFNTYEVINTAMNREAITHNGDVSVEFYSEYIPSDRGITINNNWWNNQPYYTYTANGSPLWNYTNGNTSTFVVTSASVSSTSIETGRIDSGGVTNQDFTYDNSSYNSLAFQTVNLKILPASTKPIEAKEIRSYCTECGIRIKKATWKYCPSCGNKF